MKSKTKFWFHKNIWYILAFIIPFVVAVTAFICQGMWPFGDRGISIIDSYHQYVPFFSELQYKWRHLDSLLYSWNGGLGMNFWAVVAYYLASPLNLLLLIFPKSMVMECFSFIYFIKISLATGQRVFEGGLLPGGYVLESIGVKELKLRKDGRIIVYRLRGSNE